MTDTAPISTISAVVPNTATAVTDTLIVGRAPVAGTVTSVTYAMDAALTGANTNTRRVQIINRGQAGAGTTVVADLQFDNAVNAVAGDERTITLSVVANATTVAEGDVLAFVSTAVGTGIADPGGLVTVGIRRAYA